MSESKADAEAIAMIELDQATYEKRFESLRPRCKGLPPYLCSNKAVSSEGLCYDCEAKLIEAAKDYDLQAASPLPSEQLRAAVEAAAEGTNPKDRVASAKVDLSLIPPAALVACALAFTDGGLKYGPYNWREVNVKARVYVSAGMRHLAKWLDGEDADPETLVHHLGYAMACPAILLDAIAQGTLHDDRPKPGACAKLMAEAEATIKHLQELKR